MKAEFIEDVELLLGLSFTAETPEERLLLRAFSAQAQARGNRIEIRGWRDAAGAHGPGIGGVRLFLGAREDPRDPKEADRLTCVTDPRAGESSDADRVNGVQPPVGATGPAVTGSILDEVVGPIRAEHLPRVFDRLSVALECMIETMPEFEGGGPLVEQLATEMASMREATRLVCHRLTIPWASYGDHMKMRSR
jgi:hypothetical protein